MNQYDEYGDAGPAGEELADDIRRALCMLASAPSAGLNRARDRVLRHAQEPAGRRRVTSALGAQLVQGVSSAWPKGWRPVDLHRLVGRRLSATHQQLLALAIAEALRGYAVVTLAHSWPAQLCEIGAEFDDRPPARDWLDGHVTSEANLRDVVADALKLSVLLRGLPDIGVIDPMPGTAPPPVSPSATRRTADARDAGGVQQRILLRVRLLLAKAESTPYAPEAETFTAGAQALMARHSIDAALLAASGEGRADRPIGRRIWIDRPYDGPKVSLLGVVARANRCRAVWTADVGFVTVIGHSVDQEAVEAIFTSLLVQATRAMTAEGAQISYFGRSTTRSFRQSFLVAFAARIGERLQEATGEAESAVIEDHLGDPERASGGRGALVQVLADRDQRVQEEMSRLFPHLTTKAGPSATDSAGWAAGTRAADRAHLQRGSRAIPGRAG